MEAAAQVPRGRDRGSEAEELAYLPFVIHPNGVPQPKGFGQPHRRS